MSASSATYKLAGVMGWPVAHSRSPLLHKHWIGQYGLRGDYVLLAVQPERLHTALRGLPALGFAGCNLTIPHKVEALACMDHIDPLAKRVGAVNTVVVAQDGSLHGYNTDAFGFIQSLLDAQPQWRADAGPITVVGAGGAARAVIAGLLGQGAKEIRLTNRSPDKAMDLAAEFGNKLTAVPWNQRAEALRDNALLVNTTNQGMHGQAPLDLPLDALPTNALVSDIIYVPLETPLLAAARKRGNPIANGLGMLIHQARPAFEHWFGVRPDVSSELLTKVHASF